MDFIFPVPTPVFPALRPGFPVKVRPTFSSIAATTVSGIEITAVRQVFPLWEFELTFEVLSDQTQNIAPDAGRLGYTELQQICGLFLACRGRYGQFYFTFPEDSLRTSALVGIGDGVTDIFTVFRTIGTGGFNEPVGGINELLAVYINGIEQSGGSYNFSENKIGFAVVPPAGVTITADYTFFYLCRFMEDIIDYEQFFRNMWTLKSCKFRSTKR